MKAMRRVGTVLLALLFLLGDRALTGFIWGERGGCAQAQAAAGFGGPSRAKKRKKRRRKKKRRRRSRRSRQKRRARKDRAERGFPRRDPETSDAPEPFRPARRNDGLEPEADPLRRRPPSLRASPARRGAEGRSDSRLAVGRPSRWSNRGAMLASAEPTEADIPLTAPLPVRAVPVKVGVVTPGQDLIGPGDRISARFSLSGLHLRTAQQDFDAPLLDPGGRPVVSRIGERAPVVFEDRSIDVLRARAHLAYERIAHTEFGAHLDVELRPRLSADRFDGRFSSTVLNELYLSYGLTDFRRRGGPSWGISAGRLAIREAGYAQADGVAVRLRLVDALHVGAFVGVTGNPLGDNWRRRRVELFSPDWITGGLFGALRMGRLNVSLAGVVVFANVGDDPQDRFPDPVLNRSGLDRLYVYADAAYLVLPELSLFLNGWLDLINGQPAQNVELATSYTPVPDLSLTLGLGRFSTVSYDLSSNYTFGFNCAGNFSVAAGDCPRPQDDVVIIGADGNPVLPFDGALYTAVYNSVRLRAGYQLMRSLGIFARVHTWLRDVSATDAQARLLGAQAQVSTLRMLPGVGLRFSDPDLLDVSVLVSAVIDRQSNADASVRGRVGRGFLGLHASVDARHFFGDVPGTDVGASLSYTFPREGFPGFLMVRGSFRYFREDLTDGALARPIDDDPDNLVPISVQETYQVVGGIEWRL